MLLGPNSKIEVMEGAKHNLPDPDAQRSAQRIQELARTLTEKDLLLVLISGVVSIFLLKPELSLSSGCIRLAGTWQA